MCFFFEKETLMDTLNKRLEEKTADEKRAELATEFKKKKIFFWCTVVTTVLFVIGILVYVFAVNNPLIAIITFALFITSFMLFMYSRQTIAQLQESLEEDEKQ